ncbi:hypothetical protein EIP91_010178 [Steccherinum ochraceum]|uniref:RING-type E3 ubiquitin transferase n=1 Tax=Steccherinum ochraceum TaxID=92696 RepID=A0A4V2MX40_9APHY|nr:hypothetical protein EIP91_010178 [Steccherinum ochraceum]
MNAAEARDAETAIAAANAPSAEALAAPPRRQRSSIPSFLFISFVLYMLANNRGDEIDLRNQYEEALQSLNWSLGNYSAWLNGTSPSYSNTTVYALNDTTTLPLVESLMPFGTQLDPYRESYYSNLTGFWKGDLEFYNLTALSNETTSTSLTPWRTLADQFMASANMTNATEVAERIGSWNWTASHKFTMSIRDKEILPTKGQFMNVSKDIAIIHGKIDLSDSSTEEELRLEFDGVHFLSNGSIYTLAEPTGRFADLREASVLVPEQRVNETGHVIEAELSQRLIRLREKYLLGTLDSEIPDEGPKTTCSFKFFGQIDVSNIPGYVMQEIEDEIEKPTGVTTARIPPLSMQGVLVSRNCGILYELKETTGVKSQTLYRRITTYAGAATIVNLILLLLLSRQITRSRSAAGLGRVSRYPFFLQSLVDAVAFVGHITMAIIADGRPSISVVAPAGISCILFVYEVQFAVLIGQIQAPEDNIPPPPPPPPVVNPTPPPLPETDTTDENGLSPQDTLPTIAVTPPAQPPPPAAIPPEPPRSFFRFLVHHIRTDPGARLWTIMSFCLIVVFRIVVMLSLPLLFVGGLYAFLWTPQLYRSARRGRSSGLHAEYTIGVTLCRLFFVLYFLTCPKNILDVEPRSWVWIVALVMAIQVGLLGMQEHLGPTFFLPQRMTQTQTYDYHPSIPLPDPEAPEQSLGDCSICMDAIFVDPSFRQKGDDEKDQLLGLGRWGQAASMRKSYSLAPCHHLFVRPSLLSLPWLKLSAHLCGAHNVKHTTCLERWLAIKNICPQCRRPLPPL